MNERMQNFLAFIVVIAVIAALTYVVNVWME